MAAVTTKDVPVTEWAEEGGVWTRNRHGREYRIAPYPRWYPNAFLRADDRARRSLTLMLLDALVFALSSLISLRQRDKIAVQRIAYSDYWRLGGYGGAVVAWRRLSPDDNADGVIASFRTAVDAGDFLPGPDEWDSALKRWLRSLRRPANDS